MFNKKCRKILLSLLAVLLLFLNLEGVKASAAAADYENWMARIGDDRLISDLSIPGTHDSAARYEKVDGTAKCQTLSLDDQLKCGVRYLDIRCRHYNNAFSIHHGSVYQNLNFNDVLKSCTNFLQKHPKETIIMSVKEEYKAKNNNKSFEAQFKGYVNKYKNMWYLGDKIPKLKDVRGKIVLIRRFKGSKGLGIDATGWKDNTTFSLNNNASLYVQDCYKVSDYNKKWNAIKNTLEKAAAKKDNSLYLNYSSGYKSILGIPAIKRVKERMNPNISSYISSHSKKARYGVIAMDFITSDLAAKIINTNADF